MPCSLGLEIYSLGPFQIRREVRGVGPQGALRSEESAEGRGTREILNFNLEAVLALTLDILSVK